MRLRLTAALIVLPSAILAMTTRAEVTVTPLQVTDLRMKQIPAKKDSPAIPAFSIQSLVVAVRLEGPELKEAKVEKVDIDSAVDDLKESLKPEPANGLIKFTTMLDQLSIEPADKKATPSVSVHIELKSSSRKASAIATLKGTIHLHAGGERKTVTVPRIKSAIGKPVQDPVLTAAGLKLAISKSKDISDSLLHNNPNAVTVQVTGEIAAVTGVKLVDANGKDATEFEFPADGEGKLVREFDFKVPPTDQLEVKLDVIVGQKAITVPLDLANLPLP